MKLIELQKQSHLLALDLVSGCLKNLYAEDFHYLNTEKDPNDLIFVFNLTGNATANNSLARRDYQTYLANKEQFNSVQINCGTVRRHIMMIYGDCLIKVARLRIYHQENEFSEHKVHIDLKSHNIIFTVAA